MASVIDRVRAHFQQFTGENRRSIEVAEWGDQGAPLKIYWRPVTLMEKGKIFVAGRAARETDFAELVALKAEDAAGERMFPELADAHVLKAECDQAIVTRIGVAMMSQPTVEGAAKNS